MEMEKLQTVYELEKQRLELEQAYILADQDYRQAQFDHRESWERHSGYEGFSLAAIRDRIRGCYDRQLEQYRREARNAEAKLLHARQELEQIRQKQKKNAQQREALPAWEAVRDWIGEDAAGLAQWSRLELELCKLQLRPLLEQTRLGLLEAQRILRGDTLGEVMTASEQQQALSAADGPAQKCKETLERMEFAAKQLEIPVKIPGYFQNPVHFLASATKFTRFDRYADAICQTEKLIRDHRE